MRGLINDTDFDSAVFLDTAVAPVICQWQFGRRNPAANFLDHEAVAPRSARPQPEIVGRLLTTPADAVRRIEWRADANLSRQAYRVAV